MSDTEKDVRAQEIKDSDEYIKWIKLTAEADKRPVTRADLAIVVAAHIRAFDVHMGVLSVLTKIASQMTFEPEIVERLEHTLATVRETLGSIKEASNLFAIEPEGSSDDEV